MKFFLTCCVVLALYNSFFLKKIAAQEQSSNSLILSAGVNNLHLLDRHSGFLIFHGTGISPCISYEREKSASLHKIEGLGYFNHLVAISDNYQTRISGWRFRYTYFHTLFNGDLLNNHFTLSPGISFTSLFLKSDYEFYLRTFWAKASESWYGSHSLDIDLRFEYSLGKSGEFLMQFNLPLIGNVARPAYSPSDNYDMEKNDTKVSFFGDTRVIPQNMIYNLGFSYRCLSHKRIFLEAVYNFSYVACHKPELVKWYMNNFRIGVGYKF